MDALAQRLACIEVSLQRADHRKPPAAPLGQVHWLGQLEQHVQRVLVCVDGFPADNAALRAQKRDIRQRSNALLDAISAAKHRFHQHQQHHHHQQQAQNRAHSWHVLRCSSPAAVPAPPSPPSPPCPPSPPFSPLLTRAVFEGGEGGGTGLRAHEMAMEGMAQQSQEGEEGDAEWVLVDDDADGLPSGPPSNPGLLKRMGPSAVGEWVKTLGVSERLPRSLVKNGVDGKQLLGLLDDPSSAADFRRRFRLSLGALTKLLWELDRRDRQENSPQSPPSRRTT